MNRRQKIIISVIGIFLVLLLLVGLTYAYFLTRINGNTNTKSISVSTANLALVYGGDDGSIIGEGEVITPGTTFNAKTFTVTNQGNAKTDYVVVIENVSVTYAETIEVDGVTQTAGSTTTFQSNDFVYTLTCTSGCNGVDKETTFPINGGILVGNSIDVGETQTYAFTLTYKETGLDQTDDMNKTLNARLNIKDISTINPYSGDTSSLAYNIINNAIIGTTGTVLRSEPETKVAEEISLGPIFTGKIIIEQELDMSSQSSWYYGSTYKGAKPWNGDSGSTEGVTSTCTDTIVGKYISYYPSDESWYVKSCKSSTVAIVGVEEINYEKTLSVAQDDLGTSYYYRGNVQDNYVTFADMCWRIVRINGDGSTKLILEDQDEVCSTSINGNWAIPTTTGGTTYTGNFGYTEHSSNTLTASDGTKNSDTRSLMDYLYGQTNSDRSMATAFKNFQSTFTESELSKLKAGNWCLGDNAYDSSNNLLNSTQTMDNKIKGLSFNYDSNQRLYKNNPKQPTLKCNGTIMNDWDDAETNPTPMYVGAITADEIVYAGGKHYTSNENYYLINKEFKKGSSGANKSDYFWSLSPSGFPYGNYKYDSAFYVEHNGGLGDYPVVSDTGSLRPAVSLASGTVITGGNGTQTNPYVVG